MTYSQLETTCINSRPMHWTCLIKAEGFVHTQVELCVEAQLFYMAAGHHLHQLERCQCQPPDSCLFGCSRCCFPPKNISLCSRDCSPCQRTDSGRALRAKRLLHASLSHVKLSLVAQWLQQWPKTAAPQKHSHAFHARLPQKCCSEIDTLFDVLLPAVNWEEHLWPFWSPAQSPKCSSLLNRSVADAKQSLEVTPFLPRSPPQLSFSTFLLLVNVQAPQK